MNFSLPDEWLGLIARPNDLPPAPDPLATVRQALQEPVGSPRLCDLARPGMRAAVIVDDYTRHTPIHLALPLVLEELHAAGLSRRDIRIAIALGSHRLMSDREIVERLGGEIAGEYAIVNAHAGNCEAFVYLGEGPNGIPAWVNRAVVEADLRIGIGIITPHLDAGFSGGAKIILPGVCGMPTIDAFHAASAYITENQLGNPEAPLRQGLEEFVAAQAPLHFIVNLVLTVQGEVFACVAGHAVEAHRHGVEAARRVYGASVERRYPIVIANCAPYDQDLWQSIKGIWCGDLLVEDGGTLIAVTAAPEGSLAHPLLPAAVGRKAGDLLAELRLGNSPDPKVTATGVMVSNLRRRIDLSLVTTGLSRDEAQAMRLPVYAGVEEALANAIARLSPAERPGCVAVLPYAGFTLPVFASSGLDGKNSGHKFGRPLPDPLG